MAGDVAGELRWLKANPAFEERPATVNEFLAETYLNIESGVRPVIREMLGDIMGPDVTSETMTAYARAMITGGIGIGKTTIASIVLPWLCHWVLCLKNPQEFFNLLPGSRIAFMQMSTSEDQAKEVLFGDIKARILHSPWFRDNYPFDPTFKNQIRFPKDIWILPGDSKDTTFEGYNILGGIIDEADSHTVTKTKDYAQDGYDTIDARISSRFGAIERADGTVNGYGCLIVIGQMKRNNGFASKIYGQFKKDPKAYARRLTIWESLGWSKFMNPDGTRDSFWYDTKRKEIVPKIAALIGSETMIEIPNAYRDQFENNPEKALKDLAGIPPATGDPFISLTYKIEAARDRWNTRYPDTGSPAKPDGTLEKWFRAPDSLPRVVHIDMAYSGDGDALGLTMGHVREVVTIEDELKPYISIDLLYRWQAPPGAEIFLGDVRRFIYHLRDDLKFKIKKVTMDGFQSTDTRQQLQKRRFESEQVSCDKTVLPYHDLREAIYEDRIEFPEYMVYMQRGDTELVEVAYKELTELTDEGLKIDHPEGGSKDVADSMAGVTYTLMGDRRFRRNVVSITSGASQHRQDQDRLLRHPALGPNVGIAAPIPPGMSAAVPPSSAWDAASR